MIPVFLTRIRTSDGTVLSGITVLPKRKSKVALIHIHGIGSKFYNGQPLIKELAADCRNAAIGYFKFNTRGHDAAAWEEKGWTGAGFEEFKKCVFDIRAMIRFARRLGYTKIVLAGHSTGANKALYYIYKTRDRSVKKLVLLGPVSDIAGARWNPPPGLKDLDTGLAISKRLLKKNKNALMPQRYGVYTAQRFWSLYHPGEAEDVFPYHNPKARWKELRSVHIPLVVIFGSRDQYLDRPMQDIMAIFRENAASTSAFSGIIIKDADHSFHKKEKELSRAIIQEIKNGKPDKSRKESHLH